MVKLMSAAVMSAVLVFPAQAQAAEPLARAPQPVPMAFASADSQRIWLADGTQTFLVKVMGHRIGTQDLWQVGKDGDSQPVAIGQGRFLVVATNGWITFHTLNGRTGLIAGTQPDWHF